MRRRNLASLLSLLTGLILVACGAAQAMEIHSDAFQAGGAIPKEFGCSGKDTSLPLAWSGVPASAKSLALIISDPDAPSGNFVHWVVYNIPPGVTHLGADIEKSPVLPGGGQQGRNGTGGYGYFGPCPPPGSRHHYHIVLYAVDEPLSRLQSATAAQLEQALKGHVVAQAELIGTYGR